MAKKRVAPTFKDLLKQPTWSETEEATHGAHAIRPGKFNHAGEFFSPSGTRLEKQRSELTPAQAQRFVAEGALVAYEGCGCGGSGGCTPSWANNEQLVQLRSGPKPRYVKGFGSPTWIDLWADGSSQVVFAHGDVEWGSIADSWPA